MKEITVTDYRRMLREHNPVSIHAEESDLEKLSKSETGGVILLPDGRGYFPKFMEQVFSRTLPEEMDRDFNFMLEEVISNGAEHGNEYRRGEGIGGELRGLRREAANGKEVHFLWHRCNQGIEVYVVDEGERKFNVDKVSERREALGRNMGCELSGWVLLRSQADEYEFYSITSKGEKKGTLVKIVIKDNEDDKVALVDRDSKVVVYNNGRVGPYERSHEKDYCGFVGHELLGKGGEIRNKGHFPQERLGVNRVHSGSFHGHESDMQVKVYDAQEVQEAMKKGKPLPEPYLLLHTISDRTDRVVNELVSGRFERTLHREGYRVIMQPYSIIDAGKKGVFVTENMLSVEGTTKMVAKYFS